MPQSLNDIKRKIRSISGTRQITKAMELVSSAKFRKSDAKLRQLKPYFEIVTGTIGDVLSGVDRSIYTDGNGADSSVVIVITSDKGMAGGYNSNLIKYACKYMEGLQNPRIIAVGAKGRDYFLNRSYILEDSYTGLNATYENAQNIGDKAAKLFANREVGEVHIIYTHFKSGILYEPSAIKLLPAKFEGKKNTVMNYEPSGEVVLSRLIPMYLSGAVYGAMTEASASENGSRRLAMENATNNASDILDELHLQRNRARQAAITREISEIVGGSEAVKD